MQNTNHCLRQKICVSVTLWQICIATEAQKHRSSILFMSKFLLTNFVVMNIIITGASKGIGKAIAEIFAANGHNLFLCSRGELALYKTVE